MRADSLLFLRLLFALGGEVVAANAALAANPYGYEFTVTPNPAPVRANIAVTIETTRPPCVPLPATLESSLEAGRVLQFVLATSDGCLNLPLQTRTYDIGPLQAGRYTFRFMACGGNPPPGSPGNGCVTYEEQTVAVRSATDKVFSVPANSLKALTAVAVLILMLAVVAPRLSARSTPDG